MDDHEDNILSDSLAKRRRVQNSLKKYQNKMLNRTSSKKNIIPERKFEETSKNSKDSCQNPENESLSSIGSIIENSDDENLWPVKNKNFGMPHESIDNISLKRTRSSSNKIQTKATPIKIEKESKKVIILSNIKLNSKQSNILSKNKVTSGHCTTSNKSVSLSPNPPLIHDASIDDAASTMAVASKLSAKIISSPSPNVSTDTTLAITASVVTPADCLLKSPQTDAVTILKTATSFISSLSPVKSTNTTLAPAASISKSADFLLIPPLQDAMTVLNPSANITSPLSLDVSTNLKQAAVSSDVKPVDCFIIPLQPDATTAPMISVSKPTTSILNSSSCDVYTDHTAASTSKCTSPFLDESSGAVKSPPIFVSETVANALSPSLLDNISAEDIAAQQSCCVPLTSDIDETARNLDNKKRKRRRVNKFRKACIDFVSDEESKDFSDGSSDYWSAKETDSSSDEEMCKNKRKQRQKRKKTTSNKEQSREENIVMSKKRVKKPNKQKEYKKLREQGKAYTTNSGNEMPKKELKENPCVEGKCGRGCYKIPEERRKSLFEFYWALEPQRRRDWLVRSRRQTTYEYYLNEGEDHVQVCQQFILKTLDITQKFLLYTVSNATDGMAQVEKRHSNAPIIDESIKTFARMYIEQLPAVPSHYCRKDSTCVYLPQEFKNLSNVYRLYIQQCRSQEQAYLTEASFSKIFREEFNIRFHTPKKDKCSLCIAHENNTEPTLTEIEIMKVHLEEKKATYQRFKLHQNLKDSRTVVCSFDLQKVLNTPYGESMLLYYSRKYAVYNLTMYESDTQNVSCYVWGESDGKRGANEIATCLYKYLKDVDDRGYKNVLLYCDSCSGQNKNKIVLAAINHFLHVSQNVDVVQINYLLPGHTYMPVDSVHAVIENEVKKVIVWSPDQWPTYMESARKRPKPYSVNVLEHSDFINWDTITGDTFTKITHNQIKMRDIRVATLKKKDLKKIYVKYSMKDDTQIHTISLFEKTVGKGKGRGKGKRGREQQSNLNESQVSSKTTFDLPQLYENRLCISNAKSNDLKRLCQKYVIPRRFHSLYMNLPTAGDAKDTLPETDEDESEID